MDGWFWKLYLWIYNMARRYIKNCTGEMDEKREVVSDTASRFIFRLLLAGFFVVAIYILFFSSYLKIINLEIEGTNEINEEDIREKMQSFLDGKILKVIPQNNFILISHKKVSDLLQNDFKKIRSVTTQKKFPDFMKITIEERKAMLVWCAGDNCFLIDENGVAYNVADFNSQEILQNHLIRINDQNGRSVALGEKIMDFSYEQYVLGIKDALKNINCETSDEAYATPTNVAEEVNVRVKKGFQIYFSSQYSLEKAIHAMDVVLKKEIPEDSQGKLEYFDLRSEGKVFYKFKNEEEKPEEAQNENQNQ